MNKCREIAWPCALNSSSLQELGDSSHQSWLCCEKSCEDYHSFYWFYISLHLIDKDDFMTPRNLLVAMKEGILYHLSNGPANIKVLLVGSASEQSAALVCATLEEWFPHNWLLTVLDRCQTPLNRIRKYLGTEIGLVYSDFSKYQPDGNMYDLIIGDCILEFNAADNRLKILQNISALLSDTGISVLRERTGDVSEAMEIGQESEYLIQKTKNLFLGLHIPFGEKDSELIERMSYRFLLQILDSHDAYGSKIDLEKDLSRYLAIVDEQTLDNVSRELIYHYYLLKKKGEHTSDTTSPL